MSFRFDRRIAAHLKRRSEEVGEPQAALAERYVEEGLRMDEHPLIAFRGGAAGRRAALVGTRLDVATVIETVRQNDNSVASAADYLDVPVAHVEACVRYYVAYKKEIDDAILKSRRAAERERELWRRQQEALAG